MNGLMFGVEFGDPRVLRAVSTTANFDDSGRQELLHSPDPAVMRAWSVGELLDFRSRVQQQMGHLDEQLAQWAETTSTAGQQWLIRARWAAARTAGTLAMLRSEVKRRAGLVRDAHLRPVSHAALVWEIAHRNFLEHTGECASDPCQGCDLLGVRLNEAEDRLAAVVAVVAHGTAPFAVEAR